MIDSCPNCQIDLQPQQQSRIVTRIDCENRCNTAPTVVGAIRDALTGEVA